MTVFIYPPRHDTLGFGTRSLGEQGRVESRSNGPGYSSRGAYTASWSGSDYPGGHVSLSESLFTSVCGP